jgi:hypothetical protein
MNRNLPFPHQYFTSSTGKVRRDSMLTSAIDDGGFRSFGEIYDSPSCEEEKSLIHKNDSSKITIVEALRDDIVGSYQKFIGPFGDRPGASCNYKTTK